MGVILMGPCIKFLLFHGTVLVFPSEMKIKEQSKKITWIRLRHLCEKIKENMWVLHF
jgi:hypothetical protein